MPPNGFDDFGPHRSPPPPPPSSPPSMPPLTASSSSSDTSFSLSPVNRNSTNNTSKGSLTTLARRLVIHPEVRIGSTKDSYPASFNLDPMDGVYLRPSTDPWGLYGDPHNPVEPYPLPTWDNPDAEEDEGGGWVHFEANPPEGEGEFDLQAEAVVMNAEFEREQGAIARGEIVRGRKKWVYGTFWARDDKRFMKKDDGFFGAGGNGNGYGNGNGSSGPILRLRGPRPENNNRKGSPPPGYYSGDRDRDGDVEMGDVITVKPKAAIQYGTRRSDRNRNRNRKKERASMEDERRIGFIEIEGPKLETTGTSSTDDGGEDDSDDGSYTPTGASGKKKTNSKDKKKKGHTNSAKKSKDNNNGSTKRRRHSSYEMKETRVGLDDSSWAKSARKAGGAKAITQGPYGPPGSIKAQNFYHTPDRGKGGNGGRSSMPPPPKSGDKWHRGSRIVRSDDESSSKTKYNKRAKQKQSSNDEAEAEDLNLKLRQVEVEVDDAERQKRAAAAEARRNKTNNNNRGKAWKNEGDDDAAEMKGRKGGGLGMKMKDRMGGKPNITSAGTTTGSAGGKEKKGKENTGKGNDGQDDEDEEGNGDEDMSSLD